MIGQQVVVASALWWECSLNERKVELGQPLGVFRSGLSFSLTLQTKLPVQGSSFLGQGWAKVE